MGQGESEVALLIGAILTALVIILVFTVIILVHEAGHFIVARRMGVRVERFAMGFGRKIWAFRKGDTEYAVNVFPLGGYVKLAGEDPYERSGKPDEFYSKPVGMRLWILLAGSLANYILALVLFSVIFIIGVPTVTSEVGGVLKGSPAYKAGIREGDRIVSIDDKKIKYWNELVDITQKDVDRIPLLIVAERGDRLLYFTIIPDVIEAENIFRQKIRVGRMGIAASQQVELVRMINPFRAVYEGSKHVIFLTVSTYKGLWFLITGAMPVKESVMGPVGIVGLLSKAVKYGPVSVLSLMGYISLVLAIMNLLPFPVLDGGHILFLAVEKIRKKPLSAKVQDAISQAAVILLIAFFLYVTYHDTLRLFK